LHSRIDTNELISFASPSDFLVPFVNSLCTTPASRFSRQTYTAMRKHRVSAFTANSPRSPRTSRRRIDSRKVVPWRSNITDHAENCRLERCNIWSGNTRTLASYRESIINGNVSRLLKIYRRESVAAFHVGVTPRNATQCMWAATPGRIHFATHISRSSLRACRCRTSRSSEAKNTAAF